MNCPRCHDLYDDKDTIPMNLTCGHSTCFSCIRLNFKLKKVIICCICKKVK